MASTNTSKHKSPLQDALGNIPTEYRGRIIKAYLDVKARHAEAKHDAAGLSAGKLCEAVLRLLQSQLGQAVTPLGQQIPNFQNACDKLAALPKDPAQKGNEALRVVIPRALAFLYTLRNKRGIGHEGGDIDANAIDGATITRLADWIVCELIRIFHTMSLEEADALVASLASRNIPDIWEVGGKLRILRKGLSFKEKTLLLLYQSTESAVLVEDLCDWSEHSNISVYRNKVLRSLHAEKYIEYDRQNEAVTISPLGNQLVETEIHNKKAPGNPL